MSNYLIVFCLLVIIALVYYIIKQSMDKQLVRDELANTKAKYRSLLDYVDRLNKSKK